METTKQIKAKKHVYYLVIQQYCGGGWYDADFYECNSTGRLVNNIERGEFRRVKGEYILMGYPIRVIKRRELNG